MITDRLVTATAFAAVSIALSACASVTTQWHQDVVLATPLVVDANCSLQNERGTWTATKPGPVRVTKSKTPLEVRCTKEGYRDTTAIALVGIEPWFWGNFVIGGLLGMGLDWATGSIHKYRSPVTVFMTSTNAANPEPAPTASEQPVNTASNSPPTN